MARLQIGKLKSKIDFDIIRCWRRWRVQGKKIAAALGAVALIMSMCGPAGAVEDGGSLDNFQRSGQCPAFSDVGEDWTRDGVVTACELGLMKGTSGTTFSPDAPVTVQEAIILAARLRCVYSWGSNSVQYPNQASVGNADTWATAEINYAIQEGIIKSGDFTNYKATATRAQMAYIFANALPESTGVYSVINTVDNDAIPDVRTSDPYGSSIYKLYRSGVLTGGDGNVFAPTKPITRAETAAIVSRLPFPTKHQSVTLLNPNSVATSYLADGVTVAPYQGHVIYVGKATKTTAGQPRSSEKTKYATTAIAVKYGFHNYNSNSQAEYNEVISGIQNVYNSTVKKGTSALAGTFGLTAASWQVVDNIIAGKSYDKAAWDSFVNDLFPAVGKNIGNDKMQAETIKLYGQYRLLYTSTSFAIGETGGISAYDAMYNDKASCVATSHVCTAIADMLGINAGTFASADHQSTILLINGVYFSGEGQMAYTSYDAATSWATEGAITEFTSAGSPLK